MQLTIAAGILAQALPTVSTGVQSKRVTRDDGWAQTLDSSRVLVDQPKWQSGMINNKAPQSEKRLKNRFPATPVRDCDPTSSGPDIGILSCGLGYQCAIDQGSGGSSQLGGICIPTVRNLQQQMTACYLCADTFVIGQELYEVEITATGYEGQTCEGLKTAAYVNQAIDVSVCDEVAQIAQEAGCCTPKCYFCGLGQYISYELKDFVVDDQGTTCGDLYVASYFLGTIDIETCPSTSVMVQEAGCCVRLPFQLYDCNICGDLKFFPEAEIASSLGNVSCYILQVSLNDTMCAAFAERFASCCEASDPITPTPSMGPPSEEDPPVVAPTAVPSSSATWWTASALFLSIAGSSMILLN